MREGDFSLQGLLGFDLHGKTAGIVGTGKIGGIVAETLLHGFGCRVLAHDLFPSERLRQSGVEYVGLDGAAARRPTSSACTARSRRRPTTSSTGAASRS